MFFFIINGAPIKTRANCRNESRSPSRYPFVVSPFLSLVQNNSRQLQEIRAFNPRLITLREKGWTFRGGKSNSSYWEFRFSQVYPSNEKYFKGRSNFGGKGDDSPARKLESRILLIIIHRCKGRRASVHRFDIVRANFSTSRIINRTELGWFEENTGKRKWPRISRQLDNVDNRPSCNIHKPWTTRDEKICN